MPDAIELSGLDEVQTLLDRAAQFDVLAAPRLAQLRQTTAQRVLAAAKDRLARHGTGASANAITLRHDGDRDLVEAGPAPGRHPMLPVWLEYGTVKMPAQPYMEPACQAAFADHIAGAEAVAQAVLEEIVEP